MGTSTKMGITITDLNVINYFENRRLADSVSASLLFYYPGVTRLLLLDS